VEQQLPAGLGGAADLVHQGVHRVLAHRLDVLAHGGERRVGEGDQRGVVEAAHRDVPRHLQTPRPRRPDRAERHEVAAALFTMPGAPMVFAGDEIGMEGLVGGEDARRPFPWHRPERWDRTTLRRYRALGALRRSHHALRHGGLRRAHAEGDTLAFLRESEQERLLVLAARAEHAPLRLPAGALGLAGEAPNLYGGADPLRPDPDGSVTLPGDGPTFQLWQLA